MGDAASPANDSERAPDAVPPAEPPSKEGPGPGKVCFTTLPTEGQHGGNEDATSFDLAFTTVHVRGGAPVKVLSTMKASDFGDGEIYIKAAPGEKKLLLHSPMKAFFHGPAVKRCEAARLPAKLAPPEARAKISAPETRAWASKLKAGGSPIRAKRVPHAAAEELRQLIAKAKAGTTLRWVRVLAPPAGSSGPSLLVAAHFDRQRATLLEEGETGVEASIGMLLVLLADDGSSYGLLDSLEGRLHVDAPWGFSDSIPLDDDEHPDTILRAPTLVGETVHEGLIVALTSWRRVSLFSIYSWEEPPPRELSCFARVDGRPAFLMAIEGPSGSESLVKAFVADATGHFSPASSLYAQSLAWSSQTDLFTPPFSNSEGIEAHAHTLDGWERALCPGGGEYLDLRRIERGFIYAKRYWRFSTTAEGVGRKQGVVDLTKARKRR